MKFDKLVPWNWFKREAPRTVPAHPVRGELIGPWWDPMMGSWFHREVERLFEDFRRDWDALWGRSDGWDALIEAPRLEPRADLEATDKEYRLQVDLPGVKPEDVQVEISGDLLRIRGERRREASEEGKDYERIERSYGVFMRSLSLPDDADAERISATLQNGVLTVVVPRKESAQARRIEVKAA